MRRGVNPFLFWFGTAAVLFVVIVPLLWVYITAFKSPADIYTLDLTKMFVFEPTLENFNYLFSQTPFWHELRNTAIVSVVSTVLVMLVSLPAAYSFARWNTGSGHLLFITISTRMFPAVVAAIPLFFMYKTLNLSDTHFGLILLYLYLNMSFATFLLFGFFREIPKELEEAARVDGYGRLQIFRKIVFPLVAPGAAITAMFCLVFSWNEFLFALLFTRLGTRTLSLGISSLWGAIEIQWGPMAAGVGLAILPTLIAAWFMQRYIIRGLTFGAVRR
ncbi:Diacetylchitobiose uptake system permease protein DasC [subsurface metagenome]